MLTPEMIMVMGVILAAVFLFVVEWVRVDVVAIMVMLILPIMGLVSPQDAFSGLSSNAVVSIIAVIIIGAGLDQTGIMNKVVKPITLLAGNSESRLITLVSGTVAIISSFMQNIGAVALFLPATRRVCEQMRVPPSRVLMPMGYLGIIGGCLTLIGSSPLILLNDLLKPQNLEPFGLFDVTPVGAVLIVSGLIYFLVLGKLVLPGRSATVVGSRSGKRIRGPSLSGGLYELAVPPDCICDKTLEELAIRPNYLVTVVAIAHWGTKQKVFAPTREDKFKPRDTIAVFGMPDNVKRFAADFDLALKPVLQTFESDLSPTNAGIVDVIIPPLSELVDVSMRSVHFRKKFQVVPLAIKRQDKIFYGGLADIVLQSGDFIVMHGIWERFAILKESNDFFFVTEIKNEIMKTNKAGAALACFLGALALVASGTTELAVALLTGAVGMILTGVLSIDEAYKAVDWRTVFLLAGLIPLGMAAEQTGAAAYIATFILDTIGEVTPVALIAVIAFITSLFTLVISNVGATVLLVPLAINMASSAGADPRMAALAVAIAASNTFILPTHQVNAFIMGPGGYKTKDYLKAGGLMTLLYLIVMVGSMYLFFGLSA